MRTTHNAQPPLVPLHENKLNHMALPTLDLTLQFGEIAHTTRHKTALPRGFVSRCIRHALAHDAEITVRIVDTKEGQVTASTLRTLADSRRLARAGL